MPEKSGSGHIGSGKKSSQCSLDSGLDADGICGEGGHISDVLGKSSKVSAPHDHDKEMQKPDQMGT